MRKLYTEIGNGVFQIQVCLSQNPSMEGRGLISILSEGIGILYLQECRLSCCDKRFRDMVDYTTYEYGRELS